MGIALLWTNAAFAQDPVTISNVEIGLGGQSRLGHWAPVSFDVEGGAAGTELTVAIQSLDGGGTPCEFTSSQTITAGKKSTVQRFIRVGRTSQPLTVVCRDEAKKVLATKSMPVNSVAASSRQQALILGTDVNLGKALRLRRGQQQEPVAPVHIADAKRLPAKWYGYDSFDIAMMVTGDNAFCDAMTKPQIAALRKWISLGGNLVVSVGSNAEDVIGKGGPLECFAPGEFTGIYRQGETTELEDYSKSKIRLDLLWNDLPRDDRGIDVARFKIDRGLLVASDGVAGNRTPWVIRTAYGLGSVTVITADLSNPYLAEWKGRNRLVASIVDGVLSGQAKRDSQRSQSSGGSAVTHLGFGDVSGQLRSGLDQFPGVKLVPFSLIAGVALLFILIIGPVDWFVLRKFAPRMEWTWFTFPLALVALSGLAFGLARSWKGASPKKNVVDLIDVDPVLGVTRCTSWAHLYPVEAGRYSITAEPNQSLAGDGVATSRLVAWEGLPGGGLGGMQDQASASPFSELYQIQIDNDGGENDNGVTQTKIDGLAIPTWSSRSLGCVWWSAQENGDLEKENQPPTLTTRRGNELIGTVRNPLPVPIRDAAVAYGRLYYEIGTLQPGQQFDLVDSQGRDFRYRLTRRRIMAEDGREVVSSWDKASLDVPRIMEMMMFHDRAGGKSYTNLQHRFHDELDLSDHLITGSAVLMGRLDAPATEWTCGDLTFADDDTRRWTYCRVLMPVKNEEETK